MASVELRFEEVLRILVEHEVDFILVGGIAAVLHGSPLTTEDLDLVYDTSESNIGRLAVALEKLEARYIDPAGRHSEPDVSKLGSMKMHFLRTNSGRVDLLTTIAPDRTYAGLMAESRLFEVEGVAFYVLGLRAIIESKAHANRPKDRFQLPFLRQLEEEIRENSKE